MKFTKMRIRLYFILLGISLTCCGQQKTDRDNCPELNNLAVASLQDYLQNGQDTLDLLKSLEFYDKAIGCDSSNAINYMGKLTVINMLGRFSESLKLNDKLYELSEGRDVHMLTAKGVTFERLGMIDSSKMYFDRAILAFDRQLALSPPDSLRIIGDRLYVIAITEGKASAIEKLQPYLAKYPNDSTLKLYEQILRDFDRKTILPGG
jgi:tetratricopeptide (TPR) repeat protein